MFSPDGMTVVAGSWDRCIYRWNPDTGESLKPLQGVHSSPVRALAYSPDGKRFASGDESGFHGSWEGEIAKERTRIVATKQRFPSLAPRGT